MEPINYRTIFKKPIIINSIADFILPFSIELKRALLVIPTALFLYFIHRYCLQILLPFMANMTLTFIYYGVGCYFISGWLSDEYTIFDNKNLLFFLKSYFTYFITLRVGKRVLTNNEVVKNLSPSIKFSKAKL